MIKEFQIDDTVSFKGNVDFDPIEPTKVAWVDNNTYQAIVEHPDGHTGDEIPGKGLNAKKTYAFVKTDHLEPFVASEESETTSDQAVKDVAAEKVEEVKEAPKKETTGEGPGNDAVPEKPIVVVSDQLVLFKENVNEQNHELIDILYKAAYAYETGQAFELKLNDPEDVEEAIKSKTEIPTGKKETAEEEDTRSAAEKIAAHEAEAKEMEAQEQRLKSQAEQRQKILDMVVNGIMKGVLEIKEGPVVKNGEKTTSFVCFLGEEGLVALDHKEDTDSIVNYFQNVPADFTDFAAAMATAGTGSTESDTKTEESGTKSEETDTETGKSDKITYKKGEGSATKEEAPAEEESTEDLKAKFHSKLTGLSGIGPAKANMIMKIYGTPEELIAAYKAKKLDKMEGVSAGIVKSLKTACKGDYFLN